MKLSWFVSQIYIIRIILFQKRKTVSENKILKKKNQHMGTIEILKILCLFLLSTTSLSFISFHISFISTKLSQFPPSSISLSFLFISFIVLFSHTFFHYNRTQPNVQKLWSILLTFHGLSPTLEFKLRTSKDLTKQNLFFYN